MEKTHNPYCDVDNPRSHVKWTISDAMLWKFLPEKFTGGAQRLHRFKDSWILHNSTYIQEIAQKHAIPSALLAGVAWAEVAGMPDFVDSIAFPIRYFDWSGPDYIDQHFTITNNPLQTSVGSVSIQLRVAAKTLGLQAENMDFQALSDLKNCLETDRFNLEVVAQHLKNLIIFDYPKADTNNLTDEQFIVAASRYNRGTARKKQDYLDSIQAQPGHTIRTYSEYGRAVLRRRAHVIRLLVSNR